PLQHLRPLIAVARHQLRAFGEITEDGVRFRHEGAILELENRDAAIGVPRQELAGARLALLDVDLDIFVGDVELGKGEARLVAIARIVEIVETQHIEGSLLSALRRILPAHRRQDGSALGPVSMPGTGIDVAGVSGIDEAAAPSSGKGGAA